MQGPRALEPVQVLQPRLVKALAKHLTVTSSANGSTPSKAQAKRIVDQGTGVLCKLARHHHYHHHAGMPSAGLAASWPLPHAAPLSPG